MTAATRWAFGRSAKSAWSRRLLFNGRSLTDTESTQRELFSSSVFTTARTCWFSDRKWSKRRSPRSYFRAVFLRLSSWDSTKRPVWGGRTACFHGRAAVTSFSWLTHFLFTATLTCCLREEILSCVRMFKFPVRGVIRSWHDMLSYQQVSQSLESAGQSHVLQFWPELSEEDRDSFLQELSQLDLKGLRDHCAGAAEAAASPTASLDQNIEPVPPEFIGSVRKSDRNLLAQWENEGESQWCSF